MSEIRCALATHYHIDHAGLGQGLEHEGITLLVLDVQAAAIASMKRRTKPRDHCLEITPEGNRVIDFGESRGQRIAAAG